MKIAVLVSGGVDSSVALKILKDEGHDVTAFYIKIWMEDKFSHLGKCPWEEDLKYVEAVCDVLGVPFEIVNLQKEYWDRVVSEAIAEVKEGRTPNPDIWCNERVKFGAFYDYISSDYEKVATGHYARILEHKNTKTQKHFRYELLKAPDPIKDQTYFLSNLSQEQLSRALFPIGGFVKDEVRELAKKFDLPNKDRKDSQGICFLGAIKYRDFVREYLGIKKGKIVNKKTGEEMGEHDGFWFYTIGQRKYIGLSGGPWYVIDKDVEKNIIYIGGSEKHEKDARDQFEVCDVNWISEDEPENKSLRVKIRHGARDYRCEIEKLDDNKWKVKMSEKDNGVAVGQHAVFYDGDVCLGGGVICK